MVANFWVVAIVCFAIGFGIGGIIGMCIRAAATHLHISHLKVRPSWDKWLFDLANLVSRRSHDPNTKYGAIVVDDKHRIVGVGYNGFPRGKEIGYPTYRTAKYKFMVHAELNAILNSNAKTEGCTLYVTGFPCSDCMKAIVQAGIKKVVYIKHIAKMLDAADIAATKLIAKNAGVKLSEYKIK